MSDCCNMIAKLNRANRQSAEGATAIPSTRLLPTEAQDLPDVLVKLRKDVGYTLIYSNVAGRNSYPQILVHDTCIDRSTINITAK